MELTAADLWRLEPGRLSTWECGLRRGARAQPAALTLNQHNHLHAAASGAGAVWLAAVVHIDRVVEAAEAEQILTEVLRRHPALRTGGLPDGAAGFAGLTIPAEELVLRRSDHEDADPTRDLAATLVAVMDRDCRPGRLVSVVGAVVVRPSSSSLVVAFDHQHGDAHSVATLVHEIHRSVTGVAPIPAECTHLPQDADSDPGDPHTQEAMQAWEQQVAPQGHRTPVFPLPVGLAQGEVAAQRTVVQQLLDLPQTRGLAGQAHAWGGSTFAVVLTTLARAVAQARGEADLWLAPGGADPEPGPLKQLYLLIPVSKRQPRDLSAVGWFTTTVPVVVPTSGPGGSAAVEGEHVQAVVQQLRLARTMAEVPLNVGLSGLSRPLEFSRRDLFMLSYVDYTRLPGAGDLPAEHVSAATVADDVQLWVSRTPKGLALRARTPDTMQARVSIDRLIDAWRCHLRQATGLAD